MSLAARFTPLTPIQKLALWQVPLIFILSAGIGWFLWIFWAVSWGVSSVRRWWLQLPILVMLFGSASQIVPVKTADFFILILVVLLAFTWRIDAQKPDARRDISPAGLCPTIFLVGSVFIYQTQFIILLALVAWLLAFLLWFTMALTGFKLDNLSIRWAPIIAGSFIAASIIVLLFSVIPRINTGFIPSFATAAEKIGLTDELSPGGMTDLLASDEVAFRAVPADTNEAAPRYWRVFILSEMRQQNWHRVDVKQIQNNFIATPDAKSSQYQIVSDTHDLSFIPVPGWPDSSASASVKGYGYNIFGEAIRGRFSDARKAVISGRDGNRHGYPYPETTALSAANPALQDYGRRLRQTVADEQAFIDEVMDIFATEFTYSTQSSYPEKNALDAFFFEGKSGHCSYFATAMATILRAGGVPAHVGVGYLGGEWNGFGDFWLVNQSDAHAWVEVKRADGSWQRLDPTLQVMQLDSRRFQGLIEYGVNEFDGRALQPAEEASTFMDRVARAAQFFDSVNLRITLAIMNYGDDASGSGASRQNSEDRFALFLAVIGIGVTAIFVVLGAVRLSAASANRRPVAERKLEKTFAGLLGDRPAGMSLPSYCAQLRVIDETLADEAVSLAHAIYQMRFGQGEVSLPSLAAKNKELRRRLRAVLRARKASLR